MLNNIMYDFDRSFLNENITLICGTDEAGAGPLAGPVYAAAVILDPENKIEGLNDSKKLSEKKRELLFEEIVSSALDYSIASISESVIDEINILKARMLAMRNAVAGLKIKPDILLVDGNSDPHVSMKSVCIIGGDGKSASIAAASILAKVSRDRFMKDIANDYPQYGFDRHKGYGTKQHLEAIKMYGACPIHRRSFLTKVL